MIDKDGNIVSNNVKNKKRLEWMRKNVAVIAIILPIIISIGRGVLDFVHYLMNRGYYAYFSIPAELMIAYNKSNIYHSITSVGLIILYMLYCVFTVRIILKKGNWGWKIVTAGLIPIGINYCITYFTMDGNYSMADILDCSIKLIYVQWLVIVPIGYGILLLCMRHRMARGTVIVQVGYVILLLTVVFSIKRNLVIVPIGCGILLLVAYEESEKLLKIFSKLKEKLKETLEEKLNDKRKEKLKEKIKELKEKFRRKVTLKASEKIGASEEKRWKNMDYTILGVVMVMVGISSLLFNAYSMNRNRASGKHQFGIVCVEGEQYAVVDGNEEKLILKKCQIKGKDLMIDLDSYLSIDNNVLINFKVFDNVKLEEKGKAYPKVTRFSNKDMLY